MQLGSSGDSQETAVPLLMEQNVFDFPTSPVTASQLLHINFMIIIIIIQQKIFFRLSFFLYSPCHYMRAWIRILDAPGCHERAARVERESALQDSGLVRTVGSYAQRRVALMPRAIATARDALSNDWRESAACFERPAKQALALATEPRAKREARSLLCHTCQ